MRRQEHYLKLRWSVFKTQCQMKTVNKRYKHYKFVTLVRSLRISVCIQEFTVEARRLTEQLEVERLRREQNLEVRYPCQFFPE